MVAVDTNILVRLITKDDINQFAKAYELFSENEVFISDTVILELEWVLRYSYKFQPSDIYESLGRLFGLDNVFLEDTQKLSMALEWHQLGLDFSDAFHLVNSQHCSILYSFDSKFVKYSSNLSRCMVKIPD